MRKFMTTISAIALSAGVANAGSMVVPQEPIVAAPAPMMMSTYDWTGGYAGLGLTYGRTTYRSGLAFDGVETLGDEDGNFAWPSGSGWGIGGFVGFNWQSGNMVYGVEGHLSAHRMRGSRTGVLSDENDEFGDVDYTARTSVRSIASLRGRVGFAQDRTLFFVTAGPAMASIRHSATLGEGEGAASFSESRSVNGVVIGAGIEHAMANGWNIRGDLEHYRFRGRNFNTLEDVDVTFPNVRARTTMVRVSTVFRF